jgi:hypothetical protein
MAEPCLKKRRQSQTSAVQSLLHVGNITNDGLTKLLSQLKEHSVNPQELRGTRLVRTAFLQRARDLAVTIPMRRISGGDAFEWTFLDPNRLLSQLVAASPALQKHVLAAAREAPPSMARPWHLVLGYDEFAPGNKLKIDNSRKMFVLSFSFLELGHLQNDMLWFTPVAVRSSMVHGWEVTAESVQE